MRFQIPGFFPLMSICSSTICWIACPSPIGLLSLPWQKLVGCLCVGLCQILHSFPLIHMPLQTPHSLNSYSFMLLLLLLSCFSRVWLCDPVDGSLPHLIFFLYSPSSVNNIPYVIFVNREMLKGIKSYVLLSPSLKSLLWIWTVWIPSSSPPGIAGAYIQLQDTIGKHSDGFHWESRTLNASFFFSFSRNPLS